MRRLVAALVTALVLLAPALTLPATAASGALVTGKILDADGNPIPGATISLTGFVEQTTASDGSYSFRVPTRTYYPSIFALLPDGEGKYWVGATTQVAVVGDMTKNFTVPAVVPVNLTLRNTDSTPAAYTPLHLPQSTAWQTHSDGTVVKWSGVPWHLIGTPQHRTDGDGKVTFSALAGSTTTVQADRANMFPVRMPIAVAADPTDATLTLPTLRKLSGRLGDDNDTAIAGADLRLTAPDGASIITRTRQDGSYAVHMPDGTFELDANFSGFPTAAFSNTQVRGEVTVSGDTGLDVKVPSPATLVVRLRHIDGSPATEATVTGITSSAQLTSSAGTPLTLTSRYRNTDLTSANGTAITQSFPGAEATVDVAIAGQGTITGVVQMSGSPTTMTIIVAATSATLTGVVRDDDGNPLSGAQVAVQSVATKIGTSVTTASDGSWTAKVVPGEVEVTVQHHRTLASGGGYSVTARGIVEVLTTATQDVVLPTMVPFAPRLLDAADQPMPGVKAYFMRSEVTRSVGGVDFDFTGSAFADGPSDASGILPMYALPDSTVTGILEQPDRFTFDISVKVPPPGEPSVIRIGWFGSVPSSGPNTGRVDISGPPNTTLTELTSEPAASTPDGQTALVGNVGYTLSGVVPGSTNDITLTLPAGSQPTSVFKVAEDGTTTDATPHATISGNTIVLHLTDGGFGDADGVVNGVIVDPVIPTRGPTRTVSTKAPTITGTARVGNTLTAHPGTWSPGTITPAYQWLANDVVISGATRSTYVPTAGVRGKRISVRVTGKRVGYVSGVSTSSRTSAVVAGLLIQRTRPYVAGTRRVGRLLAVRPGAWAPSDVTVRYVWLRDGRPFTGVTTRTTYRQTRRDRGHRISVRVIVAKVGYSTRTTTTASAITR